MTIDDGAPGPVPLIGDASPACRILIGICSAHGMRERRDAVRDTWLRTLPEGTQALFFAGAGSARAEAGLVCLPVADDYASLSLKVHAFFLHALAHYRFDFVFKCDDDTYVHVERLKALAGDGVDFVGSRHFATLGYASGGAGYLVARPLLEQLVRDPVPARWEEDVVFSSRVPKDRARWQATDALQGVGESFPEFGNDVVTGHWCPPAEMRRVHARVVGADHGARVLDLRAVHRVWSGAVRLFEDNVFWSKGPASPHGTWHAVDGGQTLLLRWHHWPVDALRLNEWGFAGPDLRLEFDREVDRTLWIDRAQRSSCASSYAT